MTKISDQLFLGDAVDANDPNIFDYVDRILNVSSELGMVYRAEWSKDPQRRHSIPFHDNERVSHSIINSCVIHIDEWIKDGHRVLVHCLAGISRSPSVIATYLCLKREFSQYDKAIEHLVTLRPKVEPAKEIRMSCIDYLDSPASKPAKNRLN